MIQIARPMMGEEEKQAVLEVLESGILAQGPRVKAFEENFARMCGVKHAIATSSGTTALHTSLLAHGIKPGDEVITSSFTFIASANSILYVGARPVFVDIDPRTFNLDPEKIEAAISPRTRAILPVHLFGMSCDMDLIQSIAANFGLAIIEDACQSHGATFEGRKVGSFGTGVFSFYPTKNITAGEGGMITTNDDELAERCRAIRQHGMRRRYYHDELGFNFRMTEIQAAIGNEQLKKLEIFNQARQANAAYLSERLQGVTVPYIPSQCSHVFHQYTIRIPAKHREGLMAHLAQRGVSSMIYYPIPIHKQPFYMKDLGYDLSLSETELAASEVLSLPVHPGLSLSDLETIVAGVNDFTGSALAPS